MSEPLISVRASNLSVGQQQRVAIARALANDPPLIVADEPTGNLDTREAGQIIDLFEELVTRGKTIVMVTHDPNSAAYAERILFLDDGAVVDTMVDPTAERVLEQMKHLGE